MIEYEIFLSTSQSAASDLKGNLQQVLGDGQNPGKWHDLSVAIIRIDDFHLILTNF